MEIVSIFTFIIIALLFSFINALINHLKKNDKNFLALFVELFLYIIAIQAFLYYFNSEMYFELFFLIVFYIEARVFGGIREVLSNRKKDDE